MLVLPKEDVDDERENELRGRSEMLERELDVPMLDERRDVDVPNEERCPVPAHELRAVPLPVPPKLDRCVGDCHA